jgi:hypothetical protein
VFYQHTQGLSQCDLASNLRLGKATIERWYHRRYHREHQTFKSRRCPRVLGIDKKQGYATTFGNLQNHTIFDVAKGRSAKELTHYHAQVLGKEQVKVICIDLSSNYRRLIQRYKQSSICGALLKIRVLLKAFIVRCN